MMSRLFILLFMGCVSLLYSCKGDGGEMPNDEATGYNWAKHQPFETDYTEGNLRLSDSYFPEPESPGDLQLDESSGLAWSVANPGMLWTHEDTGNPNILFLLDTASADIVASYQIVGTLNTGWEDIAVASGPEKNSSYVYIANTGDNDESRSSYSIYRFKEPVFREADRGQTIRVENTGLETISFSYPDGSHDTEALLVDPDTHDLFLATKQDEVSRLYVLPYPQNTQGKANAYLAGLFPFKGASGATVNLRGDKVVVRTREYLFYWTRQNSETLVQSLSRMPLLLPNAGDVQGEAICFDDADNYYTSSERGSYPVYPPLHKYIHK